MTTYLSSACADAPPPSGWLHLARLPSLPAGAALPRARRRLLRRSSPPRASRARAALPQPALGRARRPGRARRRRVGAALRPLRAAPGQPARAARAALSRPPVRRVQPRPRRRPRLPLRAAPRREDGRLLDLGTKGSGADALVARRRRAADAQGRRARGARDGDARGAGRATSQSSRLFETGEALHAQRRALAHALRGARPPRPLAHPLRHLPAASRIWATTARLQTLFDVRGRPLLPRRSPRRGRRPCRGVPRAR